MGEFESNGIFAAAKMTHLSDDKTVAKMGHLTMGNVSDVGHPSYPSTRSWGSIVRRGEAGEKKVD